jgi:hypothetical protein
MRTLTADWVDGMEPWLDIHAEKIISKTNLSKSLSYILLLYTDAGDVFAKRPLHSAAGGVHPSPHFTERPPDASPVISCGVRADVMATADLAAKVHFPICR